MRVSMRYRPVADAVSRERADARIAWLRDYGERRINSRLIDERRTIPPYVALDFGRQGLFGVQVEERFGGLALRSRDVARILEQAAGLDLALGTWLLVCLFPGVRPLAAFGGEALHAELLADLAAGRVLAGYAQTEPGAGTHFPAMAARAVPRPGGGWSVSGQKVWIGNASWAGILTVMAHECDESGKRRRLIALAVPTDRPGVELGGELLSMGMRGMVQSEVAFRDVVVPPEHLVGDVERGLEVGVDSMSWSRFAIAATCLGAMRRCAQLAARFASRRSIATGRLLDHPVVLVQLGEIAARVELGESILYRVAELLDAGDSVPVELFAVAKLAASEFLWESADATVQMLGSRGYDEENLAPQLLRDARVTRIFEGTSEALRAFLGAQALSRSSDLHGALRETLAAPGLADELDAALDAMRGRGALSRAWQCALAGEAASWAILAAAAAARPSLAAASPGRERAIVWARLRFEAACADARAPSARERVMLEVPDAEKTLAGFADVIGDVDQRLPAERLGLDPLLRRA